MMRVSFPKILLMVLLVGLMRCGICRGALLPDWNNYKAYSPIPVVLVHGMNSSPEAWGFLTDPDTGNVVFYFGTAVELRKYFDDYLKHAVDASGNPIIDPNTGEMIPLIYLEPFNYQFNTFDSIKWNAWEGWDNNGNQYPDKRIIDPLNRSVLKKFIGEPDVPPSSPGSGILGKYQTDKVNLVAHSLGGVVSRYYMHNTKSGGANVLQLTTLGSPHRGTTVATISEIMVGRPVTDMQNMGGMRKRWVIKFFSIFFSQLTVDRYPMMISELNRNSNFIGELNEPFSIPRHVRYYCIADALVPIPCTPIVSPIPTMTDGFIDLDSALASLSEEQLPCPTINLEEYKPKGYLPKYKGRLLSGWGNWHIKLTNRYDEVLKAIDDTKPVIEVTEIKNSQNTIIWRVGQWPEYFEVPTDGRLKVRGLCRKEYLPADTYINIGFRKAGQTDVNWITESGGTTPDQTQARQWLLQPSDLWIASNPDSPVAEFEVEMNFPLQEVTHSIVVQATNPAGIKSDPVEVSEKTLYIYAVGKDSAGEARFLCLDGPTSFNNGIGAVVSEFSLIDEAGNKISARPLDVATDRSDVWVSFDNRRIYCYDINTMKPKPLLSGGYYYTTTVIPDGLYYDGSLQYCSSSNNKIYRINLSNGQETDLGVIKRRLSLDGVATDNTSVQYTTQEYTGYNPTAISQNYLCSLGKISKRDISLGQNSLNTLPSTSPIWTNEQTTPDPIVGIAEVTDYSVPEGYVVYLSGNNGNIYKVRFKSKTSSSSSTSIWSIMRQYYVEDIVRDYYFGGWFYNFTLQQFIYSRDIIITHWQRYYGNLGVPPSSIVEAFAVRRVVASRNHMSWNGASQVWGPSSIAIADVTYSFCTYNYEWLAEQKFRDPVLGAFLWTDSASDALNYNPPGGGTSPLIRVTDITSAIQQTSQAGTGFIFTGRYGNEGQDLGVGPPPIPYPIPIGYINLVAVNNNVLDRVVRFAFLTDNGSLETLDQFSMASGIAEGIAIGPRVKIRIEPEFLLLNTGISREFKVNGKGTYIWSSSDETVAVIEGIVPVIDGVGETVTIKAGGIGVATISVIDSLGNIAYTNVDVS